MLMFRISMANYLAALASWWESANSLQNKKKPLPAEQVGDKYNKPEWLAVPNLGDLFDCSEITQTNLHASVPRRDCGIVSETKHSRSPVYEYQVESRKIQLFHCRMESHKLTCDSNLFNAHDKDEIIKSEYVSANMCGRGSVVGFYQQWEHLGGN